MISNKFYTILKWALGVALAPTIALITSLGALYNWKVDTIVQTISIVATFLSAIFGISITTYKGDKQ